MDVNGTNRYHIVFQFYFIHIWLVYYRYGFQSMLLDSKPSVTGNNGKTFQRYWATIRDPPEWTAVLVTFLHVPDRCHGPLVIMLSLEPPQHLHSGTAAVLPGYSSKTAFLLYVLNSSCKQIPAITNGRFERNDFRPVHT